MTKQFNTKALESIAACIQAESETDNLSVPTLIVNNEEKLRQADSGPSLTGPKAMNNVNISSTRQVKNNLQLVKTNKEISKLAKEFTRIITNDEFINVIFRELAGNQRPLYCSFTGHPGKVSSGQWFARPYIPGKTSFDPEKNNYFTLSSFRSDSKGNYYRRKDHFCSSHAIMLDDLGSKAADLDQLPIPPSWVLQTSPGNYQVGYIFRHPIADGAISERIMNAIIAAGFCDPGAGGPLARYARLPVGINGKYDPPFHCRLEEWHPERRYSTEEIIDGFNLGDIFCSKAIHGANDSGEETDGVMSKVFFPSCRNNPIVTKLKEMVLYKRSHQKGMHEIVCPWKDKHTGNQDSGTYYYEPDTIRRTGGFKCFHGHCKGKNIYDLCLFLNINYLEAGNWPTIRIIDGHMNEIVDSIERVIAGTGKYFQRGGEIVTIKKNHFIKEPIISKLPFSYFIRFLDLLIRFERFDKRFNEWAHCNPPSMHSKLLYDGGEFNHLPILHFLNRQPYIRPDLSLMAEPGYDKELRAYGWFDKNKFSIPNKPTKQQAEKAFSVIKGLLNGFRFKSEHDMAAACSAILAATIRSSLPFCPMFHCRAPQASSGKSYLCRFIRIFSTPVLASAVSYPASEEECRKILLALLMSSPEVVCFDNLISDLIPYKSMCSVLTEEHYTDRILGGSTTATVPTGALFLSNGNNVGPVRDMCRRVVTIDVDPVCENPAQRSFEIDPVSMVLANREHYVSLVLTIIMAWIAAGSPRANVPPIASYNMWSDLCRQPLLWLGCPDPATSLFRSLDQDPDREILGRLLHAWYDCFGNRAKMIRDAIEMASHELNEVFLEIAADDRGNINRKRLGRWISRHASRIVDGLKFERESGTRSAEAWRAESLSSVISVSERADGASVNYTERGVE